MKCPRAALLIQKYNLMLGIVHLIRVKLKMIDDNLTVDSKNPIKHE